VAAALVAKPPTPADPTTGPALPSRTEPPPAAATTAAAAALVVPTTNDQPEAVQPQAVQPQAPQRRKPPKVQPVIQPYVPPPDIPAPVTPSEPVISAVTPTPPVEPHVIAPPPVVAPPAPKPSVRRGVVRLAGDDPVYPRQAVRAGVEKGRVIARVMIDEKGNVYDVIIVSADPPRHFDRAVIDALKEWKFKAEGEKYVGEVEINFSLKD